MGNRQKVMVLGAAGQVGTDLVHALVQRGYDVIATDIRSPDQIDLPAPYAVVDATSKEDLQAAVERHGVTMIYHLVAMLSATAERSPRRGWHLNMNSLFHVLELAREKQLRVFWPSSIAAFGPTTPVEKVPQHTITEPTTVYGISKVAGELWCQYYHLKYGVDVRSVRYPGLIGWRAMPGGGTTDYAVDIFYHALREGHYRCFLGADTVLPMMYMPDAVRATIELMEAPAEALSVRTSYNIAGMSFAPQDIVAAIRRHIPDFSVEYVPDHREAIARTWPRSIDDAVARADWGWAPAFDLDAMVGDMLVHIREKMVSSTP